MKYKQENIKIGDMLVPTIYYKNIVYYPLSYIFEKVLLKGKQSISKLKENGYSKHLEKFKVDYSFVDGNIQSANCINKEGLIELLKTSNIGGLTVEQKVGMNLLLEYFDMDLINEKPRFIDNYDYIDSNEYDKFEKDCITETLKEDSLLRWQLCKDCERYFPLHNNFFRYNTRDELHMTICKNCLNTDIRHRVSHTDNYLNMIYDKYGEEAYVIYSNHNTIEIYNHYIENELKTFPKILDNAKDYTILLECFYENGNINKDNLTLNYLKNELKLNGISDHFNINQIHRILYHNHPVEYPWKYPHYLIHNITFEEGRNIFNNYLNEMQIHIEDIYNFNYAEILKKAKLRRYENNILNFVMKYYNDEYPAYKFNVRSINYWKSKENRDKALKYLIEEDMKLEIEKIPLYLTFTSIRNIGTNTMYNVLKNYYSGIFEWVNEIYPNVFNPKDFDINYMRNEFDSLDEQTIDDILRNNFNNVLYNPRNTTYTIKFKGKIPDWLIFTDDGCIIVEYFGLWDGDRGMYNSRTKDYIESSKDKLEKYKELKGYKFLYLYPEDLRNNFERLNYKIKEYIDLVA